jgi:uracil-DNA glycosylase
MQGFDATLTVPPHQHAAHAGKGCETLMDTVIRTISAERSGVEFLLWGGIA